MTESRKSGRKKLMVLFGGLILLGTVSFGLVKLAEKAVLPPGKPEADLEDSDRQLTGKTKEKPADEARTQVPGPPSNREGWIKKDFRATFHENLPSAPFPYDGKLGDDKTDFFDYTDPETGRRFHTNRSGRRYSEAEHYSDSAVLFHLPPGFDPERPITFLVFFHGHLSGADQALADFRLDQQVDAAGRNVVLICPQLAKNAVDSSPGKLFLPNGFADLMAEAAEVLAFELGEKYRKKLSSAPVVLAAFSGGYKAAAYVLDRGGLNSRIKGVLLLDALFEDEDKFGNWLLSNLEKDVFLVGLYTKKGVSSQNSIRVLAEFLEKHDVRPERRWPLESVRGRVFLVPSPNEHLEVPLKGPPRDPLTCLLQLLDF